MARDWVQTNKPFRANQGDRWVSNGAVYICTSGGRNASFVNPNAVATIQGSIYVRASNISSSISSLGFDDGNGITWGVQSPDVGAMVLSISHDGLTNQSQFVQSNAAFAGTNASGTIASNGISVSVAAPGAGGGIAIAVPGTTRSDSTAVFSNSNGITFGINGYTVTASHNGLTTAMASDAVTLSNIRFSAGTTSNLASAFTFADGNGISFGLNAGTITGSHNALTTAALSNHSHGNPTLALTNLSGTTASNSAGLTLSLSAGAAGGGATISDWNPPWAHTAALTNSSLGQNTLYFVPFDLFCHVSASRINFFPNINITLSTANSTGSARIGMAYALYTHGTGASTTHISRLTSYSLTLIHASYSTTTRFSATHYIGLSDVTSHSTSQVATQVAAAGTYPASSLNGHRVVGLPVNSTLAPGRYWVGLVVSTEAAGGMGASASVHFVAVNGVPEVRPFGTSSAATNASVFRALQGWGSYSATSGGFPDTIALTTDNIRAAVNQTLIHFDINAQPYTTNFI